MRKSDLNATSENIPPGISPGGDPWPVGFDQAAQHFSAGRLDLAAGICRAILATTPQHAPALHLLGVTLAERRRPAEGVLMVERALELDRRNPVFHLSHGRILMRCGNPAAAVEAFKESAHLDPGDRKSVV